MCLEQLRWPLEEAMAMMESGNFCPDGAAGAQSVSGEDSQLLEAWDELPKESQQKILEVLKSGP